MKVFTTGASGQLAQSLRERAQRHPDIELVTCGRPLLDLETPGSATAAITSAVPDIVINAAAYTMVDQAEDEPDRAFRINADAAEETAAAAELVGAAIIHVSTDYVFDGRSSRPYDEQADVNPLGTYGRSKLAGEEKVRAANPRHAIIRTAWVYSPFERNFLKSIIAAARTGDELRVVEDQRGSPTCALDLADGLLAMLEEGDGWGETYHLAGGGVATWFEFAKEIMHQCARWGLPNAPVRPIPSDAWPTRAIRPRNSVLNSGKFEQAFGFAMPDWRGSTARTIQRLAKASSV